MTPENLLRSPARWLATLLFLAAPALAIERGQPASTLKVQVDAPPSWNILIDERVSQWFVDAVRDVFSRNGFSGSIEQVRSVDDPAKVPYLLAITIRDWRVNGAGEVDCTFTAQLHTPRGDRKLGTFSNTLPRWVGGFSRQGLARSFEEAAASAIADLYAQIAKAGLLPGLGSRDALGRHT